METKENPLAILLDLVEDPMLIKVQTIKRIFIEQMERLPYSQFIDAARNRDVEAVGRIVGVKDVEDAIILQTEDGRLMRTHDVNYMEYLRHVGRFDLELDQAQSEQYTKTAMQRIPQIFAT